MKLEDDIREIKTGIQTLKERPRFRKISREGLYIMVAIATIGSVKSCNRTQEILDSQPKIQIQNVIGQESPDMFYDLNGQRFYSEIDGKLVEQYFQNELEKK